MRLSLVLVENDEDDVLIFSEALKRSQLPLVTIPFKCCEDIFRNSTWQQPLSMIVVDVFVMDDVPQELARIKADSRTRNVPLFILTGQNSKKRLEYLAAGADEYFVKPDTLTGWIATINQMYHLAWLHKQSCRV